MPISKVFMATINYDHPQNGMISAFKQKFGQTNVDHFDYVQLWIHKTPNHEINEQFFHKASIFRPDWIWLQLQDTNIITPDTIRRVARQLPKCVITHWTGDVRSSISEYVASISKATHMTFISAAGLIDKYRAIGASRVKYLQIGVDWDEDVMGIPAWTPSFKNVDVIFCGSHYKHFPGSKQREAAMLALAAANIDYGVVGTGWKSGIKVLGTCGVKQQYHAYQKAKVALSINNFNDIYLYYSDRQLISMASGKPVVCHYVPGLEREFQNGVHCLWYKTPEELVDNVKKLLADPAMRDRIGKAGREEIIKNHTWMRRIDTVIDDVNAIQASL